MASSSRVGIEAEPCRFRDPTGTIPSASMPRRAALALSATIAVFLSTVAAAQTGEEAPTTRNHVMTVAGSPLRYASHVGRMPIRIGGTSAARAHMFYVAYRVVPERGRIRPLTVIWNGGPGGSMMSMLTGGQGPKRIEAGRLIDNAETLLPDTDLLYIDAPGSGFSRLHGPEDAPAFYQTKGDNDAFVECILAWRRWFAAEEQPVYLAGVSWGAYRVAAVAHALAMRGVTVGGGVMKAGRNGLARPGSEARFLPLGIVHYPRVAALHGRLSPTLGTDIDRIEADVRTWADQVYLPALQRRETLSAADRTAIARRLSLYSGLPLASIDRESLVVTPRAFTEGLLADRGQKLASFDMRRVVPAAPSAPRRASVGERYIREHLGYRTSLSYLPLVWDTARIDGFVPDGTVPPEWNYLDGYYADGLDRAGRAAANERLMAQGYPPGGQEVPLAVEAMRAEAAMRMVVIHGRYDALPSSCASTEAQLAELDPALRSRVTFRCVDSGHALFVGDAAVGLVVNRAFRTLWNRTDGAPPDHGSGS